MTKINNSHIIQQLNNNCLHKDLCHVVKLEEDDLQIDNNYWHRGYCLNSYGHFVLCDSCSNILKKYKKLYNTIIESAFETFNKILQMINEETIMNTNEIS